MAIGSILLLTWINGLGIQESKWVQRIFTLAKLVALAESLSPTVCTGVVHVVTSVMLLGIAPSSNYSCFGADSRPIACSLIPP